MSEDGQFCSYACKRSVEGYTAVYNNYENN